MLASNEKRLESLSQDLIIRGAKSENHNVLDVNDIEQHSSILETAINSMDGIDIVLIAHGTLPDQKTCETDASLTLQELDTNMLSTILLLTIMANHMESKGQGTMAVITSLAGGRGRQSN